MTNMVLSVKEATDNLLEYMVPAYFEEEIEEAGLKKRFWRRND